MRRRHRIELDGAPCQLDWVPSTIEDERSKLSRLNGEEREAAERLQKATKLDGRRPELLAERSIVRSRLEEDIGVRGAHIGVELGPVIIEHLGPRPSNDAATALWVDAVGRLAQHHAAFELPGTTLLGRKPGLLCRWSCHTTSTRPLGATDTKGSLAPSTGAILRALGDLNPTDL